MPLDDKVKERLISAKDSVLAGRYFLRLFSNLCCLFLDGTICYSNLRNTSMSMHDFVAPSELRGMEDFVEETDYYKNYQRVGDSEFKVHVRPAPPIR